MPAPILHNEFRRLAVLRKYHIVDKAPEKTCDEIASLAAEVCEVPIGIILYLCWTKAGSG
jgi:two-component system cell cycle sensor histidine kinase/response regulator CckA